MVVLLNFWEKTWHSSFGDIRLLGNSLSACQIKGDNVLAGDVVGTALQLQSDIVSPSTTAKNYCLESGTTIADWKSETLHTT